LGDDCGIFRDVPTPKWFSDFTLDSLALDLYNARDWTTLSELESEYFARRDA
jgi:hypothetical protein